MSKFLKNCTNVAKIFDKTSKTSQKASKFHQNLKNVDKVLKIPKNGNFSKVHQNRINVVKKRPKTKKLKKYNFLSKPYKCQ